MIHVCDLHLSLSHTGHADFLLVPIDPSIGKYRQEQTPKTTKIMKMNALTEGPQINAGTNVVFCQQKVKILPTYKISTYMW